MVLLTFELRLFNRNGAIIRSFESRKKLPNTIRCVARYRTDVVLLANVLRPFTGCVFDDPGRDRTPEYRIAPFCCIEYIRGARTAQRRTHADHSPCDGCGAICQHAQEDDSTEAVPYQV